MSTRGRGRGRGRGRWRGRGRGRGPGPSFHLYDENEEIEDNAALRLSTNSIDITCSRRESNQERQVHEITPLMSRAEIPQGDTTNQGTQVAETAPLTSRTNSTDRAPCRDSTSSQFPKRRSNQETQAEDSVPVGFETNSIAQELSGECTSSEIRRRGPNQGTQVPTNPMKRTRIAMHHNKFIQPNIVRDVTNDIKGHYNKVWPTWHKVTRNSKDLLWENFKRRNIWDIPDMHMRKIWNENGGARFRDMIYKAKQKALEKAREEGVKEPETIDMIGRGPEWMNGEMWDELVRHNWNSDDYKRKCDIARQNRMTMKDGSITKHAGGSIPFGAHLEKMKKELGRSVAQNEVFERTHRRSQGTGNFIDNKSKRVSEQYKDNMEKKHGIDRSSHPLFDHEAWCEVIGGPSKGRMYGCGSSQHSELTRSVDSINSNLRSTQEVDERYNQLLKAMEDMQARTLTIENRAREREEDLLRREEEARKREEEFLKREEEGMRKIEVALDEAKKREEVLQEMVRKLIQDVGYTNHKYAGGSGPREQNDLSMKH